MKSIRLLYSLFLALSLLFSGQPGWGQQSPPPGAPVFGKEELAQMLAPIALYPDALLSQVLMASTYPIEIIEADRWVKKNPGLTGDDLDNALLDKDWDPSVKAICHFPTVLSMMSENIAETTNIGNAFLAQQDDVMAMIQELRAKAYEQGYLKSSAEEKVIAEGQTIMIEPVEPTVIYVPYYDPFYVYGTWWYPDYPPYYWGPARETIGIGIYYWPGYIFTFPFGIWSDFDWPHHYIHIHRHHRPPYVREGWWRYDSDHWSHAPLHRRGVAYRDQDTARRYGQHPYPPQGYDRRIRGYTDSGVGGRQLPGQFQPRVPPREQAPNMGRQTNQPPRTTELRDLFPPNARNREYQLQPQVGPSPKVIQPGQQFQPRAMPGEQARQFTTPPPAVYRQPSVQAREPAPTVFNQVDQGRMEQEWSSRGSMSRGGNQPYAFPGRNYGGDMGGNGGRGVPHR